MGTSLSGLTPQNTYTGLLKFGDNSAISASLKYVSDGAGNDTLLAMSTTALNIGANNLSARLGIKGSGSTSATTSLLVQNSAGTQTLKVDDSGVTTATILNATSILRLNSLDMLDYGSGLRIQYNNSPQRTTLFTNLSGGGMQWYASGSCAIGASTTEVTSAVFNTPSTTKGFLPPVMTTTQKNAIATPAAGLMVYDTTLAKLCVYTTTWETITSL